jgi:hypothetical protein
MASLFRRSILPAAKDLDGKASNHQQKSAKVSSNMKIDNTKEIIEIDKENMPQNSLNYSLEPESTKKSGRIRSGSAAAPLSAVDVDVIYPDTLTAYLESLSDEIRCDLQDLWKSSVRYLFPGAYKDSESKAQGLSDLQNLEVKDVDLTPAENIDIDSQELAIRRMRLPSTWNEKVDKDPSVAGKALSKVSDASQSAVKPLVKGKRISLAKLYSSKEAIYYESLDLGILILGQKKMIYVEKNLDLEGTAHVVWWLMFHELSTCLLSYQTL